MLYHHRVIRLYITIHLSTRQRDITCSRNEILNIFGHFTVATLCAIHSWEKYAPLRIAHNNGVWWKVCCSTLVSGPCPTRNRHLTVKTKDPPPPPPPPLSRRKSCNSLRALPVLKYCSCWHASSRFSNV